MKTSILIDGGIGRNIAATGAIDYYMSDKSDDSELNIVTAWQGVWQGNPSVNKVYTFDHPHLWDDVLKDSIVLKPEPYTTPDYQAGLHLIQVFNEEINGQTRMDPPKLYTTPFEDQNATEFLSRYKKPVILFQPWGEGGMGDLCKDFRSLHREFAENLVKHLSNDFKVLQIKGEKQAKISEHIEVLPTKNPRETFAFVEQCHGVVGIDSFLQHAAKAYGKKCAVFWGSTRVSNTGYEEHLNIRNDVELKWLPIRLPGNEIDLYKRFKGINEFNKEHADQVLAYLKGE